MKKGIITAVIIGVGITTFIVYRKYKKVKFNNTCKNGGGTILESGRICQL